LAEQGIAMVFISHRLEEVLALAARVTVMRDGRTVGTSIASEVDKASLIEQMVGRPLAEEYPVRSSHASSPCLEIERLCGPGTSDASFTLAHGEVLGLAGLVGAGRTELARLIFGAERQHSGAIRLNGKPITIESPRDAIRQGICLLTEDRKTEGLILKASVRDNFAIANLLSWSRGGWIDRARELGRFRDRAGQLNLRYSGPNQRASELSGGNQQKLLVARWLETESRVIMFDEPTRGIDVAAKREMYLLIDRLAALGAAIIVISSEFPELLGLCDRILVMRGGRIAGEIVDVANAAQPDIMALAV
jgi:ABC-type sugar transport system ATPase subunit